MNNEIQNVDTIKTIDPAVIQKVLLHGNLAGLSPEQKNSYYLEVCKIVGLNPLTKPFDFITFQGKEVMYANKGCGEQLRMVHKIGLRIVAREKIDDIYVVTSDAVTPDGRTDSSTGAVNIKGLYGDNLANAMMKAETKAKRRVTLSICGLNMLDETEVETIPGAYKANANETKPETVASAHVLHPKDKSNPPIEVKKSPEKPVDPRKEIAVQVNKEKLRLGWSNEDIAGLIERKFNKPSNQLSLDEMNDLLASLQANQEPKI